jgi:hypothetical protein
MEGSEMELQESAKVHHEFINTLLAFMLHKSRMFHEQMSIKFLRKALFYGRRYDILLLK